MSTHDGKTGWDDLGDALQMAESKGTGQQAGGCSREKLEDRAAAGGRCLGWDGSLDSGLRPSPLGFKRITSQVRGLDACWIGPLLAVTFWGSLCTTEAASPVGMPLPRGV